MIGATSNPSLRKIDVYSNVANCLSASHATAPISLPQRITLAAFTLLTGFAKIISFALAGRAYPKLLASAALRVVQAGSD